MCPPPDPREIEFDCIRDLPDRHFLPGAESHPVQRVLCTRIGGRLQAEVRIECETATERFGDHCTIAQDAAEQGIAAVSLTDAVTMHDQGAPSCEVQNHRIREQREADAANARRQMRRFLQRAVEDGSAEAAWGPNLSQSYPTPRKQ